MKLQKAYSSDKIFWEAPKKGQQVYGLLKTLGANVNLGNIAPDEVIPLECLSVLD